MRITAADLKAARNDAGDPWAVSNGVLYNLCRARPGHARAADVTAKVLLIGRAYAAALERGRSAAGIAAEPKSGDHFYTKDVPRALARTTLDAQLAALRRHASVNHRCVEQVLETHAYLTEVFRSLTGKEKRSLASKYLHFHAPQHFFIFDSRSVAGLRLLSGERKRGGRFTRRAGDPAYGRFVLSALLLQDTIEARFGFVLTPRQLDRLLLRAFADHHV